MSGEIGLFVKKYVRSFFEELQKRDLKGSEEVIPLLREALINFAGAETDENASLVYRTFRDAYCFSKDSDIYRLIELMHTFEIRSASIVDSQRDHYVHSVNVFAAGICIYAGSERFRRFFAESHKDSTFFSSDEEFLYVWGLASLLHDIGYPVEIMYNQIRRFLRLACNGDHPGIAPVPKFKGFSELTDLTGTDVMRVLSERLGEVLDLDRKTLYSILFGYESNMALSCRVDHGFFSAVMLLKRMDKCLTGSGVSLKEQVAESAVAILLHNFYNHTFTRPPYSLPPMSPARDPVSFLLILCDELQEWNRTVYGAEQNTVYPSSSRMVVENDKLTVIYNTASKAMSLDFPDEKRNLFSRLLAVEEVFPEGIDIYCTCDRSSELFTDYVEHISLAVPEFFADRITEVAEAIHNDYNLKRKQEFPDAPLEYPSWEGLRDDLKLSNLKQAYGYAEKLSAIGCVMSDKALDLEEIIELTFEEVERLSIMEHDRWTEERKASGWVYGKVKDSDNKISPYIAPWDAIPENIKEYDREAVRNILPILHSIGIRVYRTD